MTGSRPASSAVRRARDSGEQSTAAKVEARQPGREQAGVALTVGGQRARRCGRCAGRRGSTRSRRGGRGRGGRSARLLATCAPLWHPGARMSAMPSYVAFLRAVNVGGRFVKMAELRAALEDAGFTDVETHIQSGNVFVRSRRRSTARRRHRDGHGAGGVRRLRRPVRRAHARPAAFGARRGRCRAAPHRGRQALRRLRRRRRAVGRGRRSSTPGTRRASGAGCSAPRSSPSWPTGSRTPS